MAYAHMEREGDALINDGLADAVSILKLRLMRDARDGKPADCDTLRDELIRNIELYLAREVKPGE